MPSFQILEGDFENNATNETVKGYTIVVDGEFKRVLDTIISMTDYSTYLQVISKSMTTGISQIIEEIKSKST